MEAPLAVAGVVLLRRAVTARLVLPARASCDAMHFLIRMARTGNSEPVKTGLGADACSRLLVSWNLTVNVSRTGKLTPMASSWCSTGAGAGAGGIRSVVLAVSSGAPLITYSSQHSCFTSEGSSSEWIA